MVIFFVGPCFHFAFGYLVVLLLYLHVDGPAVLGYDGDDKLCLQIDQKIWKELETSVRNVELQKWQADQRTLHQQTRPPH